MAAQARAHGAELLLLYPEPGGKRIFVRPLAPEEKEPREAEKQPPGRLTPHLWQAGISQSRGDLVVLTLAGLRPVANWLATHLELHSQRRWAVVGGPIMPDGDSTRLARVIALIRYSAFLLPFEAHEVSALAADNASYTREALELTREMIDDGFWEPSIHARLQSLGLKLWLSPEPVLEHVETNGFSEFMRQRWVHGLRFGRDRRLSVSSAWMFKYLVFCPALPALLTWRIIRRLRDRGRSTLEALRLLPELVCFNCAWSAGEIVGTLTPVRHRQPAGEGIPMQ